MGSIVETNAWDRRYIESMLCCQAGDGSSRTIGWRGQQNVPLLWPPRCVESRCFPPPGGFPLRGKTVKWDFGSFWGCFLVMPKRRHMKGHGRWRVFRGVGISNHGKLAETNAWDRRSKEPRNHVVLSGSDGSSGTSWWRGQQNVPLLWPPRCVESRCFPPLGASHCVEKRSSRTLGRFGGV